MMEQKQGTVSGENLETKMIYCPYCSAYTCGLCGETNLTGVAVRIHAQIKHGLYLCILNGELFTYEGAALVIAGLGKVLKEMQKP